MLKPSHNLSLFSRVHATLQPALSVGRSVGWSVGWSHFTFFYDFISLTSLLLPKWSGDLKYCPCQPCDQTRRYHDRRNRRRRRHFKRLLTAEFVSYDREIKGEGALAYRESNCISTSIIQLGCQHPCQRNQTRRYRASCVTHLWKLLKSKRLESASPRLTYNFILTSSICHLPPSDIIVECCRRLQTWRAVAETSQCSRSYLSNCIKEPREKLCMTTQLDLLYNLK